MVTVLLPLSARMMPPVIFSSPSERNSFPESSLPSIRKSRSSADCSDLTVRVMVSASRTGRVISIAVGSVSRLMRRVLLMPCASARKEQEFRESAEPVKLIFVVLPPVSIRMTAMTRAAKTSRR